MECIADYYARYVLIAGVSDWLFWASDESFLAQAIGDKDAYDRYIEFKAEQRSKAKRG